VLKKLQTKARWTYHPVTVFLFVQVVWVTLMVIWIQWYVEKHAQLSELAARLRTQADVEGLGWLPLIVGGILLALILAGAWVIFLYWKKQHRLNQMQQNFVANVTHELKSPVASIQLALETMALDDLPDGQRREYLGMMLDDTERLTKLITRILGAARIEKRRGRYKLEPLSLRRFIEELLSTDRHLFEKDGHTVILEKGPDARVAMDRTAMGIVFSNLIENAAKYSPRGSSIRLRLQRDLRSCRLDVIDSGIGIPRKDLRNVFKIFWRGNVVRARVAGGTGLGLYIVRNIVNDHGGSVWATSAGTGRGATFSVRLPRLRRSWRPAPQQDLGGAGLPHSSGNANGNARDC
jgi:signal transduction histidine kinase